MQIGGIWIKYDNNKDDSTCLYLVCKSSLSQL